jgi:hypothetical protein
MLEAVGARIHFRMISSLPLSPALPAHVEPPSMTQQQPGNYRAAQQEIAAECDSSYVIGVDLTGTNLRLVPVGMTGVIGTKCSLTTTGMSGAAETCQMCGLCWRFKSCRARACYPGPFVSRVWVKAAGDERIHPTILFHATRQPAIVSGLSTLAGSYQLPEKLPP